MTTKKTKQPGEHAAADEDWLGEGLGEKPNRADRAGKGGEEDPDRSGDHVRTDNRADSAGDRDRTGNDSAEGGKKAGDRADKVIEAGEAGDASRSAAGGAGSGPGDGSEGGGKERVGEVDLKIIMERLERAEKLVEQFSRSRTGDDQRAAGTRAGGAGAGAGAGAGEGDKESYEDIEFKSDPKILEELGFSTAPEHVALMDKFLTDLVRYAARTGSEKARNYFRDVEEKIPQYARGAILQREIQEYFRSQHSDLVPYADKVMAIVNAVGSADPRLQDESKWRELLDQSAMLARQILKIKSPAQGGSGSAEASGRGGGSAASSVAARPTTAEAGGSTSGGKKLTKEEQEAQELIEHGQKFMGVTFLR